MSSFVFHCTRRASSGRCRQYVLNKYSQINKRVKRKNLHIFTWQNEKVTILRRTPSKNFFPGLRNTKSKNYCSVASSGASGYCNGPCTWPLKACGRCWQGPANRWTVLCSLGCSSFFDLIVVLELCNSGHGPLQLLSKCQRRKRIKNRGTHLKLKLCILEEFICCADTPKKEKIIYGKTCPYTHWLYSIPIHNMWTKIRKARFEASQSDLHSQWQLVLQHLDCSVK